MKSLRIMIVLPLLALSACGGDDAILKCDSGGTYLNATETPRVRAPEDLDNLDTLREMPMPEASPQAERPADGDCIESPPDVLGEG